MSKSSCVAREFEEARLNHGIAQLSLHPSTPCILTIILLAVQLDDFLNTEAEVHHRGDLRLLIKGNISDSNQELFVKMIFLLS